jgi:hypothetical protein
MTRKEYIECAAEIRHQSHTSIRAFIDGARWADRNPAWRRIKDERPKDGESVLAVVVWGEERKILICEYHPCDEWEVFGATEPIDLWMPLPEIPSLAVMD